LGGKTVLKIEAKIIISGTFHALEQKQIKQKRHNFYTPMPFSTSPQGTEWISKYQVSVRLNICLRYYLLFINQNSMCIIWM